MPRKVRLYVPKGASRKGKDEEPSELVQVVSVATQTDDLPPTQLTSSLVSAQTDNALEYKDVAIQTDDNDLCVTGNVQEEQEEEQEEELALCEGNSDEKFIPLIVKHKGVFRDVTGILIFFANDD